MTDKLSKSALPRVTADDWLLEVRKTLQSGGTLAPDDARRLVAELDRLRSRTLSPPAQAPEAASAGLRVALTEPELASLRASYPHFETLWPLAPLQAGLLFHVLYDTT